MRRTTSSLLMVFLGFASINGQQAHAEGPAGPTGLTSTPPTSAPQPKKTFVQANDPASTPGAILASTTTSTPTPTPKIQKPFSAFTGKIEKNKVRMRLQPNLDGHIIRELNTNDHVVVLGESDDFYAVEAPSDFKAYIYRTFVLDGVVEGNHVNVRLNPDVNSPIIAQLNSGDPITGSVLASDKKWMEIAPPSSTRFYVSKEYVKSIGSPALMVQLQKQAEEAKKYIPLDAQKTKDSEVSIATNIADAKIAPLPVPVPVPAPVPPIVPNPEPVVSSLSANAKSAQLAQWTSVEQPLYEAWALENTGATIDEFYKNQLEHAVTLQGLIEPYHRAVKNKPGDYMLVSPVTRLPIAYLYSTRLNLQDKVGQQIVIQAVPRDNHSFAFPAYYVLSVN